MYSFRDFAAQFPYFRVNHAALASVIVGFAVVLAFDERGGAVRGGNGGFAFAPRDDLDAAMVDGHWSRSFQKT
jgi:hypothetical protein